MGVRLGLIAVLTWSVLFCHRAQAEESRAESTLGASRSNAVSDGNQPSIAVQDQSRRELSPGFRLAPIAAASSGKGRLEPHQEETHLLEKLTPFRSNKPPLLLRTAAYGLSQAVKLADHKIVPERQPLLIDAATSRVVSQRTSSDRSSACKYCRYGTTAPRILTGVCSSDKTCDEQADDDESRPLSGTETKTVQEIVDLMESLGPGVLKGSVFRSPEVVDAEETNEQATKRRLIDYYRRMFAAQAPTRSASDEYSIHLSNEEEISTASEPLNPWYDIDPSGVPQVGALSDPAEINRIETRIDALRSSAEQLDDVANQLERRDLYFQGDQLRELASQFRADARNARIALMAQPVSETEPLEAESASGPLDSDPITRSRRTRLQAELEQLLEAMQQPKRRVRRRY